MSTKAKHPNSLANLRPWKPGETGNAGGRPTGAVTPRGAYSMLSHRTPDEIRKIAEGDPKTTNAVLMLCSRMLLDALENPDRYVIDKNGNARKAGKDPALIRWLADFTDRLDGKPVQHVVSEVHTVPPPGVLQRQLAETVAKMTTEQRAELADRIADPARWLADLEQGAPEVGVSRRALE